jgi:beta-galactosidase/beta-glucuronidase
VAGREDHPRPQLTRDRWRSLDGQWQFAYDDADVGLSEGWTQREQPFQRTIRVPFPPESEASGVGDRGRHPVLWYRLVFEVAPDEREGRLLLHFGAVDYAAEVWLNGRLAVRHEGGHTPFSADIADDLREEPGQVLVVRVRDSPDDLSQPRGKQYWGEPPEEVWYHRTSGIWQTVWLEPVPPARIGALRWAPDVAASRLGVQVAVEGPPSAQPRRLRLCLRLGDLTLADDEFPVSGGEARRELFVRSGVPSMTRNRDLVWSPEHPNLMEAELTLLDAEGVVLDVVQSYVGFRSVDVVDGRLVLNGWPYYLRTVLTQGYWPGSQLAAPDTAALRADVEAAKALGFNSIRVHQKVEDPRFLYWCDRLGLLVWTEMPSTYQFDPLAVERTTREWLEVVRRDCNHPCVVIWVPMNESWAVPDLVRSAAQQDYVRALYHLTRAVDPTRPVLTNDGWEQSATDVWGVHDYALRGETIRRRYGTPEALQRTVREVQPNHHSISLSGGQRAGEPVLLSECGGITFPRETSSPWFGYGVVRDEEALVDKYGELVGSVLESEVLGGFCYTQLTDVEHEANGLLTADRRPKVDPRRIRRVNRRPAGSVPGELIVSNIQSAVDVSEPPRW